MTNWSRSPLQPTPAAVLRMRMSRDMEGTARQGPQRCLASQTQACQSTSQLPSGCGPPRGRPHLKMIQKAAQHTKAACSTPICRLAPACLSRMQQGALFSLIQKIRLLYCAPLLAKSQSALVAQHESRAQCLTCHELFCSNSDDEGNNAAGAASAKGSKAGGVSTP